MQLNRWDQADLAAMPRRAATTLVNTMSGFKNAVLIGTRSGEQDNLALFNSVIHIGAHPPLIGFILRPTTVPRHTYQAIQHNGSYTMNLVPESIYPQAHQSSAKYPEDISEFSACGLTPWFSPQHPAPYVAESPVRMGLSLREEHLIEANQTRLIVGEVREIWAPSDLVGQDGFVHLGRLGIICCNGLDAYYKPEILRRLPYAQP